MYNMYKISYNYNPLAIEITFHMVFSGFIDDVVKKESRQFLLNCFHAILREFIPHLHVKFEEGG